jgi:hypothetical protein
MLSLLLANKLPFIAVVRIYLISKLWIRNYGPEISNFTVNSYHLHRDWHRIIMRIPVELMVLTPHTAARANRKLPSWSTPLHFTVLQRLA